MAVNKYSVDMDALIAKEDSNRRELRRKKHKRDRLLSWVFFACFICLLLVGVIAVIANMGEKKPANLNDGNASTTIASTETGTSTDEGNSIDDTINEILNGETSIDVIIPSSYEPEPTEEELFKEAVDAYVASMSLQDKVAGVFVVTLDQLTGVNKVTKAGTTTKAAFEKYAVGGIVITSQNITKETQIREMIKNIYDYTRYPLFMGIDEEPGNTVLAHKLKFTSTKNAAEIGDSMDPGLSYDENKKIAEYLKDYGFNLNLGIVGEVLPGDSSVLGNRGFGQDPVIVGQMVSQAVAAYTDSGMLTAVKFFPGEGGGSQNTSKGISTTERTREEFMATEVEVFKKAIEAGGDFLIVSHVYAPNLTGDELQCSRSKYVMSELIRNEMGLSDVIIMTDAMNKAAVADYYESGEAAVASLKAGADMILMPANFEDAYNEVYAAIIKGVIAEERITDALERIYAVKFKGMSHEEILALIPEEE